MKKRSARPGWRSHAALSLFVLGACGPSLNGEEFPAVGPCRPPPARVEHAPVAGAANTLYMSIRPLFTRDSDNDAAVLLQQRADQEPVAITPERAALVLGQVQDAHGGDLGCVEVSVSGHPELGAVKTHGDGTFELAVNGDEALTLRFQREGFLSVQRHTAPATGALVRLADPVALVEPDRTPRAFTLNQSEPQFFRGAPAVESAGTRTGALFVPAGTQALGVAPPEGKIKTALFPYTTLSAAALPAELGAGGLYHAVELRDLSALTQAPRQLARPIYYYIENHLGLPVGAVLPAYTLEEGRWRPADPGRVIKVLGPGEDGHAQLDVLGRGIKASGRSLSDLDLDLDSEGAELVKRYARGQELWRVPVTTLGVLGVYLRAEMPETCPSPVLPPVLTPLVAGDGEGGVCQGAPVPDGADGGPQVSCAQQVARIEIKLTGQPASEDPALLFGSNRVAGYQPRATLRVPLAAANFKDDGCLKQIRLEAWQTGGPWPTQTFTPAQISARMERMALSPGPVYESLEWHGDRADPNGNTTLCTRLTYEYQPGVEVKFTDDTRQYIRLGEWVSGYTISRRRSPCADLVNASVEQGSLGGVELNQLVRYDSRFNTLFTSKGEKINMTSLLPAFTSPVASPDYKPSGLAGAAWRPMEGDKPDMGGLYVADAASCSVQQLTLVNGTWTKTNKMRIGSDGCLPFGNDAPATQIKLGVPRDLTVDGGGNLFILANDGRGMEAKNGLVWVVDMKGWTNNGIDPPMVYRVTGGTAQAKSTGPLRAFAAADSHIAGGDTLLYLAEGAQVLGLKVRYDARKKQWFSEPLAPLASIPMATVQGVAVEEVRDAQNNVVSHNVYFSATDHAVRRVVVGKNGASGMPEVIAGTPGKPGSGEDRVPVTAALLNNPQGLLMHGDALYIAETGNRVVRRIHMTKDPASRILELVAGAAGVVPMPPSEGCEVGLATKARLFDPTALVRGGGGVDDKLIIVDGTKNQLCALALKPLLNGMDRYLIKAPVGPDYLVFERDPVALVPGRHAATLRPRQSLEDCFTDATKCDTRWDFSYSDAARELVGVKVTQPNLTRTLSLGKLDNQGRQLTYQVGNNSSTLQIRYEGTYANHFTLGGERGESITLTRKTGTGLVSSVTSKAGLFQLEYTPAGLLSSVTWPNGSQVPLQ